MGDYVIVGDTDKYGECLVCVCGPSRECADQVLHRMLTAPTDNDTKLMRGISNLRINFIQVKDCWWRENCD